eukprot:Sdes_comp22154_c0_seq1m20671
MAAVDMFRNGSFNEEHVLTEPYTYLAQYPGKEIRSLLMKSFDVWLKVPCDRFKTIEEIVRMLHTSSLLVDDIEDNSKLRRGVPTAHKIFGIPQTLNCANYMYFQALQKVLLLNSPEAVNIFTEEMIELHRGQGLDIYFRDHQACPSEQQYKEMVERKTAGLFRLAIKLMQLFSENTQDFIPLVNILGLYFQIRDDYANLSSLQYMKSKSFCEDLSEGKFSFPIIHSILSDPMNTQLVNILKQH